MQLRPLREDDLPTVERVSERVFLEPGEPGRSADVMQAWIGYAPSSRTLAAPAGCSMRYYGTPATERASCPLNCITSVNEWAVDVGLAARRDLVTEGYLALRAMPAPAPYLPGGRFL
jgi:hypothetical protein